MASNINDILRCAEAGARLTPEDANHLLSTNDTDGLLGAAGRLRDAHKGRTVTYSRKVFLPITNLCRDRCSYCTFRKDPSDSDAWTMNPREVRDVLERGKQQG